MVVFGGTCQKRGGGGPGTDHSFCQKNCNFFLLLLLDPEAFKTLINTTDCSPTADFVLNDLYFGQLSVLDLMNYFSIRGC